MSKTPRYAYAIAALFGILAASAPANLPLSSPSFAAALLISAAIFGAVGLFLGTFWQRGTWRWGLWVIAPGLSLVTIGLITSRQFGPFFRDDLPFLATGLFAASLGGWIGSRLRKRKTLASPREKTTIPM